MKRKKQKGQKTWVIKRNLKFQDYKNCSEAAQIERKINYFRKKKIDVDSQNKFIKNNLILQTQQRFKSERHNVFTWSN